jgi:hypothetical protein
MGPTNGNKTFYFFHRFLSFRPLNNFGPKSTYEAGVRNRSGPKRLKSIGLVKLSSVPPSFWLHRSKVVHVLVEGI